MFKSPSKVSVINHRRIFTFAVALVLVSLTLMLDQSGSSAALEQREKTNFRINTLSDGRSGERKGDYASSSRALQPMAPLGSVDVDRTDDTAAAVACTIAPNDCSLRGAITFANINSGTTINVPAGTYNLTIPGTGEGFSGNNSIGDLDIKGNNTSIVGAGAGTTIINQTTAGDRVIEVNPNLDAAFITSISGVTISGGQESTGVGGGGIISGSLDNVLTLTDCVFSGNSATGAGTFGGGGVSHAGGSLTISGCSFTGNSTSASGGGVGFSAGDPLGRFPSVGTLTVSGSTFTNNTANSTGGGGAALDLFDFNLSASAYTISTSSFSSNNATNGSGGAIIVESGGPLSVTTSSLTGNHAKTSGGAILSSGSSANVRFSRLVGNTVDSPTAGLTLFRSSGLFTAEDNWWGLNIGAGANDFRGSGGVTITPATWLQLQASASPNAVCAGGSSTINANIRKRNAGADLTVELNGLPPFPAVFLSATQSLGTVSGASPNFVDGAASATFTASSNSGTGQVDVFADNQVVTAEIQVGANTTSDPADQVVCEGGTANFSTTASGSGPFTFVWKKGATVLNNGDLGGRVTITSTTNSSSLSISSVQASDPDIYTVEATGACSTASQSATLTVNTATTTTDPPDQTVCAGVMANFSTTAGGTGPFTYAWTLDGSPYDGNNASISIDTTGMSGSHTVSVTTTGACGSATQSATLTVSGAPVISLTTSNINMWPPNHSYHTFTAADFGASASGCDGNLTSSIVITSVSSDELQDNPGGADGNTLNDIVIAADCKSVNLRAERDANLNGRVYTITFRASDAHGNTTTKTATVSVPLNGSNSTAVNGPGPGYTVNSSCP